MQAIRYETTTLLFTRFIRSFYLEVPAELSDAIDAIGTAEVRGQDLSDLIYLIGDDDLVAAEEYAQGLVS